MQNPKTDSIGNKRWSVNGKNHRLDGPAVERASGDKSWFVNGKLHRLDGPACEWADGAIEWYVNDEKFDSPLGLLEHSAKIQDLAEYLTPREIAQIKLDK